MAEKKPLRILCIVNSLNTGGAETFLMKLYREIDRSSYQFDFYCMSLDRGYYEQEIQSLGGEIYYSIPKSENIFKSIFMLIKTVSKKKYNVVIRNTEHSLASLDLLAAKLGGAKVLIQRSSSSNTIKKLHKLLHIIFKVLPKYIPNLKIAPSTEAAEYTFGKGCIKKGKAHIIKNGINIEKYQFNLLKRDKLRSEFSINGKYVVGHVGYFGKPKNHLYLIDIFNEIVKVNSNSVLLLVGKGILEGEIKNKLVVLGLIEKVIFTGVRSDVPDLMMAMDVFVFPSLYEGMPNVVIEAQATGLNCIISDTITKEANITGKVKFESIAKKPIEWVKKINFSDDYSRVNCNAKDLLYSSGYDITEVSKSFINLITKKLNNN
jgi:glycosyltransferase involved in cell wall biosynthesis